MDEDSNKKPDEKDVSGSTDTSQDAPSDALSRTPDDLDEEKSRTAEHAPAETVRKLSPLQRLFRHINPYFLAFILLLIIAGAVVIVMYLNSKKEPPTPNIATQTLTADALKQLANTDATIGGSSQTLTIQGNAVINGQTLTRGKLDVAGTLQTSGGITAPTLNVASNTSLGPTQAQSLQVKGSATITGDTTLRNLNVGGTSTFSGAITAGKLTVSSLILSGNAQLTVPNHIRFDGPTPSRSINSSALGGGGSASISGSDTSGTVDIRTGNNPGTGCMVTLNFHTPYSNNPHVIISPIDSGASKVQYYVSRSRTSFSICSSGNTPSHQSFAYDYFVTN